jgi:hypothetical protein
MEKTAQVQTQLLAVLAQLDHQVRKVQQVQLVLQVQLDQLVRQVQQDQPV